MAPLLSVMAVVAVVLCPRSTSRLAAGYNFTAEMHAREPDRNAAFNRQNFNLDTLWRATEQPTLTLTDGFAFTTDINGRRGGSALHLFTHARCIRFLRMRPR